MFERTFRFRNHFCDVFAEGDHYLYVERTIPFETKAHVYSKDENGLLKKTDTTRMAMDHVTDLDHAPLDIARSIIDDEIRTEAAEYASIIVKDDRRKDAWKKEYRSFIAPRIDELEKEMDAYASAC